MPVNILFAATTARWDTYAAPLMAALQEADIDAYLSIDIPADQVDYIIYAPNGDLQDFTPYTRAKAVLSLWAGVEQIVRNPTLHIPLSRMVDPGLTSGMVEWVAGHVLRHHLAMDIDITRRNAMWEPRAVPLAAERSVLVLGLGALGLACAQMLDTLGFNITGWSRSPKQIEGIDCLHGEDGLQKALARAEIAVLLLPDTPETTNTLDAAALSQMPAGAIVINPGRGPLIDDDALLSALDAGHIAHATLDVFRNEPLPKTHRFWAHPNVTVTPHIAAETRASTAARVIIENVRRGEANEPLLHLVNRALGY